ncbi:MAG: acyl-CoA dehydrogenase [Thermoleophilia bacterium]|nr:acyl-CoA dehydrogenase [Thermoleophilia bacterium]
MAQPLYDDEHRLYRESVRAFVTREVVPFAETWDREGIVPRELYRKAGHAGLLGMAVPEEEGGAGADDFRFNAVIAEESALAGVTGAMLGVVLQNDVCLPYFLHADPDQRTRWLPGIASGDLVTAIAMTEPEAGSDLQGMQARAVREGDTYVLSGSKTFITNGIHADLVIVAARTDPSAGHRGLSLLVVERGMAGFERGRTLEKLGQHAQDTAELFFDGVRVPAANVLGAEGSGFAQLMSNLPQERLSLAVTSVAAAAAAVDWTVTHVLDRRAFGRPLAHFQSARFTLAECRTEVDVTRAFVDECLRRHVDGVLSAEDAAKAKWWASDMQGRVIDRCLQLFGGYGYMLEYPIARAFADARVMRIYGGANEIMKEIVARSMGLRES